MRSASGTQGTVRVRFFARYAELAGRSEGTLTVPLPATVSDVMKLIQATWPGASALPAQPLTALNLRHVRLDARISDGDELALLPPLAGG
ncbi:MAG TPA: MoaD/ThiS family protein [Gemmatimonadales bacterium]|jgi:molybdopterin converting factor small subunit|nr:MoaD/ThiS family protein [Gemmatimonadales bacterium]